MDNLVYLKNISTLRLDEALCTGCRMCEIVCPHEVFRVQAKKAAITDRDACMECGACALNCKAEAIAVDSGVGCAAAIINSFFREDGQVCCGPSEPGGSSSGCC